MSRRQITLFATLGIALPAFLAASGCSKITKTNADNVTIGMSEKVVTDLLGSPTTNTLTPNAKQAFWTDGSNTITVTFVDGKVVAKAFADGSETSPSGKAVASDAAAVTKPQSNNGGSVSQSVFETVPGNTAEEIERRFQEQGRIQQQLAEKDAEYHRRARENLENQFRRTPQQDREALEKAVREP
jgi:hypothetical protein